MNDWDAFSSKAPPGSATDPSDTVSASQPQRRKVRQSVKIPLSRQFLLLGLAGLVIAALVSGVTWFAMYHVSGNHGASSIAVTAAAADTTTSTDANVTATAQAVATATTAQQIYTQATSGTPAVDDPLSDNRNNWGVFTTDWGGQCAFTGGAYHLTLAKADYIIVCTGSAMSVLSNSADFALQVQMNIVKGNVGGVYFGNASYGSYQVDINSLGIYTINQYVRSSNQYYTLQSNSSSAVKAGLNQINVIMVAVSNKNLYLYINGQFVTTAYLSAYSQGDGGFEVRSNDQATDVAFSNLEMRTLRTSA
jgi:hypothetical protein